MKNIYSIILLATATVGLQALEPPTIPNELIDSQGFVRIVNDSQADRESKRLTETEFKAAIEVGEYVLLDARSAANFQQRHIKGAVNLPFTEFTEGTLAGVIPCKNTKILIYCNNNFQGSPQALTTKSVRASLNLNTQASLRAYGYNNVYELGPAIDLDDTPIEFAGSLHG